MGVSSLTTATGLGAIISAGSFESLIGLSDAVELSSPEVTSLGRDCEDPLSSFGSVCASFSCSQEHKNSKSNEVMKVLMFIDYFFFKKCIVASPLGTKFNFRIT